MVFGMPQYEVRHLGATEWEEISEIHLMQRLQKYFDRVTPAIQQMIEGEEVLTRNAAYRLKRRESIQNLQR